MVEQVDPQTLTKIVLTHLHFDHAGALTLLPASIPVIVQRREWGAAHESAAIARNFLFPRDYAIDERRLVLVDGDHDLLGDGSIELLLTPGTHPAISRCVSGTASCWERTSPTSPPPTTTSGSRASATTCRRRPDQRRGYVHSGTRVHGCSPVTILTC